MSNLDDKPFGVSDMKQQEISRQLEVPRTLVINKTFAEALHPEETFLMFHENVLHDRAVHFFLASCTITALLLDIYESTPLELLSELAAHASTFKMTQYEPNAGLLDFLIKLKPGRAALLRRAKFTRRNMLEVFYGEE
jgi:hypothetical protein